MISFTQTPKLRLKTETHLFTVKNALSERHGRIKDLVICKDSFTVVTKLLDKTCQCKNRRKICL